VFLSCDPQVVEREEAFIDLYASDADMDRMLFMNGFGGASSNYPQQMYVS
jgi:hypothetical protein